MKTKAKPAAKKAAKSAPKKTPAKKAPAKKAAKKAAKASEKYKKPGAASIASIAKKAAKLPAKKVAAIAKQVNKAAKTAKPAPKVVTGHKAGTLPGDVTQNGVLQPREGTQARNLWVICDKLKTKLGRPPARFEFRQAIQTVKGPDGETPINADSASFQYFAWRKFHGIKGRSIGIYPKRNSFEANTPAPAKVATKTAAKVPAKPSAKKTTAADVKRHERLATAAIGKPPAKTAPAPVSDRAAKASEAAKKTGGVVVTQPAPALAGV